MEAALNEQAKKEEEAKKKAKKEAEQQAGDSEKVDSPMEKKKNNVAPKSSARKGRTASVPNSPNTKSKLQKSSNRRGVSPTKNKVNKSVYLFSLLQLEAPSSPAGKRSGLRSKSQGGGGSAVFSCFNDMHDMISLL